MVLVVMLDHIVAVFLFFSVLLFLCVYVLVLQHSRFLLLQQQLLAAWLIEVLKFCWTGSCGCCHWWVRVANLVV